MKNLLLYADPGSGMMLLQVVLAFLGGILFYFRKFFYKLFGKDKARENAPSSRSAAETHVPEASANSKDEV